jgi:hypothetical protein
VHKRVGMRSKKLDLEDTYAGEGEWRPAVEGWGWGSAMEAAG